MSLEQAIQDNTAAIRELIAALSVKAMPHQVTDLGISEAIEEEEAYIESKKSEPAPTETVASSPVVAEPATEPTVQETISAPLTYKEDIMPMLTKFFAKCGREAAAELLKKYGVAKFSEVTDLVALSSDLNAQVGA